MKLEDVIQLLTLITMIVFGVIQALTNIIQIIEALA